MPAFRFFAFSSAVLAVLAAAPQAGAQSADSDVENRLLRLEEQIVDLSGQVGTLETITKGAALGGGASASTPPAGDGFSVAGDDRIDSMETQLGALSAQIGDLIERISRLEAAAGVSPDNSGFGQRQGAADGQFLQPGPNGGSGDSGGQQSGFSTYFGSGSQDQAALGQDSAPVLTAARSSPEAQLLYDQGYNALIQRNYRGAEENFQQFVSAFPEDPLAGHAYFWLGEAAFVTGQYRLAADSFLRSSTNYPQNQKAAESLLKLGISLKRLDQTDAACSSFTELERRFPDATAVLERAEREKQRSQC